MSGVLLKAVGHWGSGAPLCCGSNPAVVSVCLVFPRAGVLQGQRAGTMWVVAGPGQDDEGRGKSGVRSEGGRAGG